MRYRILLLAALICSAAPSAHAANPSFMLHFFFRPAVVSLGTIPNGVLEICRDGACTGGPVGAIALECVGHTIGNPPKLFINDCSTRAVLTPRGADGNLVLLGHPVNLRLRLNNLVSSPFGFPGGVPTEPSTRYRFAVTPGGNGLTVTPE